MKWLRALRVKPWLRPSKRPELMNPSALTMLPSSIIALYIFLVVAASLFMLFSISYQLRMDYQDWRPAPEPWQLWMNTAFLFCGSVALQMARKSIVGGELKRAKKLFGIGGWFSWVFVIGQVWAWAAMQQAGFYVNDNPSYSFFYLITGVHVIHIIGGLVAWLKTMDRFGSGVDVQSLTLSVRLCTVYWHFLLIVWLFLFYMLLVT